MTEPTMNPGAEGATSDPGDAAGHAGDPGATGESFWQEPPTQGRSSEWLAQLQTMIEQVATQAAPVIREVGAKAAELAAVAGEKAGPVAHRAAVLTGEAGLKLAERSRTFAAEIRRDQAARGEGPAGAATADTTSDTDADHATESTTTSVG